jgi:16S rRNA (guanine966-N2)-methyltransferase
LPKFPSTKARKPPVSTNQLRIIGGQWRGRKLLFPNVEGLRPTGDRIRETLFNWLAPDIQGARCLDLFAGSGALGLEALSRGASYSLLLERDYQAAQALKENLHTLKADSRQLLQVDSLKYLASGNPDAPFDVVFIDPPFGLDLWQQVIENLEQGNWLGADACIYLEAPRDYPIVTPTHWHLHRAKQAGQVSYRLYYCGETQTSASIGDTDINLL